MSKNKIILCLVLFGFVLYLRTLFNGFVWDDEIYILSNPLRQNIKNSYLFFLGIYSNIGGGIMMPVYYRPIIDTYIATIYTLFGQNAFFFHLFQILFHIINGIFIYLIFNKIFYKSKYLPVFLSLVFLSHPINTEAVVWISAIQEPLFVLFGLLAFYLTLNINSKYFDIKSILIPIFIIFLSLLIKETAILFYIVIFFYLILFNKNSHYVFFHVFFSILFLFIYFIIRIVTKSVSQGLIIFSSIMHASYVEKLLTLPKIVFFYISTFFYPKDLAISQHWVVKSLNFNDFIFPLFCVLCFFTICLIYIIKTKDKLFLFFLIWLILGIAIHSQITLSLSMTVAERWFYFPFVGILGIIGVVIEKIKIKNLFIGIFFGIFIILTLSIRTFFRIQNWSSGLTLYSNDIKVNKTSYDLENNLGVQLTRIGKIKEAGIHFKKSVKLDSYNFTNWTNLAGYYLLIKDSKNAEINYKKALKISNYYRAYENYSSLLILQKRYKEAKNLLEKSLEYYPNNKELNFMYEHVLKKLK